MAFCLHLAARGQTGYEYSYWFDNDLQTMQSGSSGSGSWQVQADIGNLSESLHAIHLQVRDSEGNLSSPVTRYFVKSANKSATSGRYWFDDDIDHMQTSPQTQGTFDIDVSLLSEGFHSIHYQVIGVNGNTSAIASRYFYKVYMPQLSNWRCWFDNDQSTMTSGKEMSGTILLDVKELSDGYHVLHLLVDGGADAVATPVTKPFIKIPQVLGVSQLTCLCMVDDKLFKQEKVSVQGGVMEWNFDVSSLPQGFHRVFIQVITPSGAATSAYQTFFMRETTQQEFAQMKCVYAIDGSEFYTEAGTLGNGTYHFDLDVSALDDGLHRISYMLSNGLGVSTKAQVQFFMKTPLGGNGITEYWYWLNDQADTNAKKVTLPERKDPFSLITLLPVESLPIRSSLFEFRVEQDKPVVYAKNDFHIRFYDASGRSTDATKQYVDESVRQEVTDVTLLESGISQTTAKPAENVIKWYKVEALRGDSLAFKTRQACTLQLFSPSGKEVYKASSPEVLKFGGIYAPEDGTYYVAVHDAMSKNDNNIAIEYQHIDKYAVLDYTPKETGIAAGYLYMELDGNGFDKLQSATLMNGDTEIKASKMTIGSKSSAVLQFALYGTEETGVFALILNFKDEEETKTLTVNDAIQFTPAKFGDIAINVKPTRRAGFPYPVVVTVKNTGNVTKLYVPFNIAASFNLTGKKPTEDLKNCSWTSMYTMNFDVLFNSDDEENGYSPYTITENMMDTGLPGVVLHGFIPELGPNETKEYILGFVGGAHNKFNLYAWTGKPLNESNEIASSETNIYSVWDYLAENDSIKAKSKSKVAPLKAPELGGVNAALEVTDHINERAGRTARNAVGIGLAVGGIENGLRLRNIHAYTDGDDFAKEVLQDYESSVRNSMPTPGQIADVAGMPEWLRHLLGLQDTQSQCGTPDVAPSPVDIYAPGDPNDISGYMAESGSKYMREGITDVYYTIEFENDPEIANASAHTIIVKDTLDTSRFDLSTFAARRVKIGNVEMELDGEKNFSKRTMDLRPAIDVIAQVSLAFDEQKGIAAWTIESLDPMSMEPTEDAMQGVLPVNVNGNGQGELTFDIKLKPGMVEGESVSNRAGILFDQEGVIMTPTWTNTVDATPPVSHIADISVLTDSTACVEIAVTDELSKPWRYDLYMQKGAEGHWERVAMNIPTDSTAEVRIYDGIDHGFYVVATDSAGNVERKEAEREYSLRLSDRIRGDVNGDGQVGIADIVAVTSYMAKTDESITLKDADVNGDGQVGIADIIAVTDIMAGTTNARARDKNSYKTYFIRNRKQ